MMTAKEAFDKTREVYLNKIESAILTAIERGYYKCELLPKETFVSDENKQILRDKGYKLTETVSMLGQEIHISWEKP